MGPRAGLDECGKSRPKGTRSPNRPARSKSLYRLSYPGPLILGFGVQLSWVVRTYVLRNEIAKYKFSYIFIHTPPLPSCVADAGFIFNVITNSTTSLTIIRKYFS